MLISLLRQFAVDRPSGIAGQGKLPGGVKVGKVRKTVAVSAVRSPSGSRRTYVKMNTTCQ
jgi:hypothetical protein